jgi:polyhydroxyalkanoate synthesis regulator protein
MNPFKQFEEMGRQNMAMFQKTMTMFNPFAPGMGGEPGSENPAPPKSTGTGEDEGELDELKSKLDELQRQLNELAGKK